MLCKLRRRAEAAYDRANFNNLAEEAQQKAASLSDALAQAEPRGQLQKLAALVDGTVQQLSARGNDGMVTLFPRRLGCPLIRSARWPYAERSFMRVAIIVMCSFVIAAIASEIVIRTLKLRPPLLTNFWDNFLCEFGSTNPRERRYIFVRYFVFAVVFIMSSAVLFVLVKIVIDLS